MRHNAGGPTSGRGRVSVCAAESSGDGLRAWCSTASVARTVSVKAIRTKTSRMRDRKLICITVRGIGCIRSRQDPNTSRGRALRREVECDRWGPMSGVADMSPLA